MGEGTSMKNKMILAAAVVALSSGGAWATLPDECDGTKTGWTETIVNEGGGEPVTTCYSGGSGNEGDCDGNGNLVQVTITSGGISYTTLTQPGSSPNPQVCLVPGSYKVSEPSCDIERTKGVGSTDFYDVYCPA
jgi:hypothetical protein